MPKIDYDNLLFYYNNMSNYQWIVSLWKNNSVYELKEMLCLFSQIKFCISFQKNIYFTNYDKTKCVFSWKIKVYKLLALL